MAIFPLPLAQLLGSVGAFAVYAVIGFGFGYALESSGFGNSTKLAGQFYFREMTVLKVMFTAILVAMVGIFAASGLGLLDYSLVWVNPTYLWPGIVGGLIMGIGFIIGGFCPGTSLVALATGKLDGVFFVAGVLFGIFLFGETVDLYDEFYNSSYMGRFTVPELLNQPVGTVVLLIVLAALALFAGAEYLEEIFGGKPRSEAPGWRLGAAATLIVTAVAVVLIGQPTHADRLQAMNEQLEQSLMARSVQVSPDELLSTLWDDSLETILLDVRNDADYNAFHLRHALQLKPDQLEQQARALQNLPANTVVMLMSNDETAATEAWRYLKAENVGNVYLLAGGINAWLERFDEHMQILYRPHADDELGWVFPVALGDRWHASEPDPLHYTLDFDAKIKLELQRGPASGGCG